MKNIFKILFLSLVVLSTSCEDELDINTNPNFPPEITPGLALTSAQTSLATVVGGELTNLGGFWSQYYTQSPSASQYEAMDQYNLNTDYANRFWIETYAGCLNDLQFTIDKSNEAGDTGTALIASLLKAYTFQLLVDLFDGVPYTEALQGEENITPAPTPGQEIYADLITSIDAAIAAYNANPVESTVGAQDAIYNANMDDWMKFANTLKLKIYLRMAYTPQANPAAVNALMAENNFITTDASFKLFGTSTGQENPFYAVQVATTGLGPVNNVASNTLHDFYVNNDDERLEAAYRPNNDNTGYPSIPQGSGNEFNDTAAAYAKPNIRQQTPVFFISLTESYFLQAEASIRYGGGAGAAALYEAGIRASFDTYAVYFKKGNIGQEEPIWTQAEAAGYANTLIAGPYAYVPSGNVETALRQVIIQKWAALPNINNIEAYIESTRTKFPEVVPEGTENYTIGNRIPSRISVLQGTQVPSILFYPDSEVERNPNMTQRTTLTQNVWWDQKPE